MNLREFAAHLARAERDLVDLSRRDADRVLAISDRESRHDAYMALVREWERNGERLRPEDDARIRGSLFKGRADTGKLRTRLDAERRVAGMYKAPDEPLASPADPTIGKAFAYWRKVYGNAANAGSMPRTARQAEAVCGLIERACDLCGARQEDRVGGSVETVRDAARSVMLVGQRSWVRRTHPPPPAGGTVQEAALWWHAASRRFWKFDLLAGLIAAGEADSLNDADLRLRETVEQGLSTRDFAGAGDPEFIQAVGKDWHLFVLTMNVSSRLRMLTEAGLGGRRLACEARDPEAVLAALGDLEAGSREGMPPPQVSGVQVKDQPRDQQIDKQSRKAGQEKRNAAKPTPAQRRKRSSGWSLARFWNAIRRWLGLSHN